MHYLEVKKAMVNLHVLRSKNSLFFNDAVISDKKICCDFSKGNVQNKNN